MRRPRHASIYTHARASVSAFQSPRYGIAWRPTLTLYSPPSRLTSTMLPSVRLIRQEETHLARQLLYQVYVRDMKWNVNKHTNPSTLRADHELGEPIDVFDEPDMQQHRHWIGKFEDSKLTAVVRVIREHNGGWELTRYGEEKVPEYS